MASVPDAITSFTLNGTVPFDAVVIVVVAAVIVLPWVTGFAPLAGTSNIPVPVAVKPNVAPTDLVDPLLPSPFPIPGV